MKMTDQQIIEINRLYENYFESKNVFSDYLSELSLQARKNNNEDLREALRGLMDSLYTGLKTESALHNLDKVVKGQRGVYENSNP